MNTYALKFELSTLHAIVSPFESTLIYHVGAQK